MLRASEFEAATAAYFMAIGVEPTCKSHVDGQCDLCLISFKTKCRHHDNKYKLMESYSFCFAGNDYRVCYHCNTTLYRSLVESESGYRKSHYSMKPELIERVYKAERLFENLSFQEFVDFSYLVTAQWLVDRMNKRFKRIKTHG